MFEPNIKELVFLLSMVLAKISDKGDENGYI